MERAIVVSTMLGQLNGQDVKHLVYAQAFRLADRSLSIWLTLKHLACVERETVQIKHKHILRDSRQASGLCDIKFIFFTNKNHLRKNYYFLRQYIKLYVKNLVFKAFFAFVIICKTMAKMIYF